MQDEMQRAAGETNGRRDIQESIRECKSESYGFSFGYTKQCAKAEASRERLQAIAQYNERLRLEREEAEKLERQVVADQEARKVMRFPRFPTVPEDRSHYDFIPRRYAPRFLGTDPNELQATSGSQPQQSVVPVAPNVSQQEHQAQQDAANALQGAD